MDCPHWLPQRRWSLSLAAAVLLGLVASCDQDRSPELEGAWQATLLIEEGDTVDVRLDDVGLHFADDGTYVYTSTLDYEESGTFSAKGNMLLTTPANQDTLPSRPLEIKLLDANRLHLNMQDGDKARILELVRMEHNHFEHDEHEHGPHEGHEH